MKKSLIESIQNNLTEDGEKINKNEVLKWSNKFVDDIMSDPKIQKLKELPPNEYGEEAVNLSVSNSWDGNSLPIYFSSYVAAGEIAIAGFNNDGTPYFMDLDNKEISYNKMLRIIKKELIDSVNFSQNNKKEREDKLVKVKEKLANMSQEEKDKIIIDYLMNNGGDIK